MEHVASSVKVYFTQDYSIFQSIKGNRFLNEGKINRIIRDIKAGFNMLKFCPIIVDEQMNVIDGQHRLYICKKLKTNVFYVIAKKLELHEIAKLNSNTEKWKGKDFLHCYAVQGNKNYKVLQEFMAEFPIPMSVCWKLLSGKKVIDGGGPKESFQEGKFVVTDLDYARKIGKMAKRFEKSPAWRSRGFVLAIIALEKANKCDFDELVRKFNENHEMIDKCTSPKEFMQKMEEIYNIRMKVRKIIF